MSVGAQLVVNGIISGAAISLIAIGFSMIYNVCKFMNFAHGAMLTIGAYLFYLFSVVLGFGLWFGATLSIFTTGIIGMGTNIFLFNPLRKKKASNAVLLIASIAVFIFTQSLMIAIFGADIKSVRSGKISQGLNILGATITKLQIVLIIVSFLTLVAVWLFTKKTKMGKAMRAVSDNKEVAETVGINANRIYNYTFFIASLTVGLGAVLIALEFNVEPNMGFKFIINGFTGAIIGGVNSVPGAILGSYLLGLAENLGIWFLPSGYKDAIAFVLLFVFLLFKPAGILGIRKGIRK